MNISLIICNFNHERFLHRCIRSAIKQNMDHSLFEIIIVDDASTDNSKCIIDYYASKFKNIKTIYNENNIGLPESCNIAVKRALGSYIYFLDSDDYLNEDALLFPYKFIVNNRGDIDACSCDYFEVDTNENILRRRNGDTYPIRCGIMFKIDDLLHFGPYMNIPREDLDFRNRFLRSRRFIYNIPIPLYRYTQNDDSMSKKFFLQDIHTQ